MPNDKPDATILNNDRNENHFTDLRSPSVKEKDKTKKAKVTSDIKTYNETEDAQDVSIRKKISDICSTIVTCQQGKTVNDIGKLPAIAYLCETLKQLSSHYGIQFDDANVQATPDFNILLKMIKKSRSFSCCLNECCIILKSLLCIFQPENSRQQLTQLQLLKELSYLYLEATDWPKSIEYAQNVLNLSETMGLQNFKADADYIFAISYARQNMFEKALLHLHAYEQYCHGTADELSEANLSFAQFTIARLLQGDEASLQHANDFLEKAKKTNDEILELKALFHLSDTHLRLFNVQQGIQFSDKVLQLAKKICHVKMVMISKIQKALAYLVLGEYQNSYDMFMECLVYIHTDYNDKNLESSVLNNEYSS